MSHGSEVASNGSGGYIAFDPTASHSRFPNRARNGSNYSAAGNGRNRSNTTMAHDPGDRFDDLDNGSVRSTDNVNAYGNQNNRFTQSNDLAQHDSEEFNPSQFSYQDLIHSSAMARLETELRDFVRSRPLSKWSEYDNSGGGFQAGGKFPLAQQNGGSGGNETSAPLVPDRNYFVERSLKESAERIYSRSSVQRYILQRLAAELNTAQELSRDFHSYEAFKSSLSAPESKKLDLVKPNVVERKPLEKNDDNSGISGRNPSMFGARGRTISTFGSGQQSDGNSVGIPSTASSPLSPKDMPSFQNPNNNELIEQDGSLSQPVYRYGSQSYYRNQERLRQQQLQQQNQLSVLSNSGAVNGTVSPATPSNYGTQRAFLNMYSFPNVETNTFYVYR